MKPKELKVWMQKNGLSAAVVAGQVRVSERTITNFLEGKSIPIRKTMEDLEDLVTVVDPEAQQSGAV